MIHPISLLPFCVAMLAACGSDGPVDPETEPAFAVVVQEGSGQQGLPDTPLPEALTVRVTRPDGTPAAGVAVQWTTSAGAVEAIAPETNAQGVARAVWRLPRETGATLTAAAQVRDAAGPAVFTAEWLPPERADLLLADAGARVRLLIHETGVMDPAAAFRAELTDSLHLLPFAMPQTRGAVIAFSPGRPPVVRDGVAWSGGRDTLPLRFGAPVRVPVTLWVIRAPYATVRAEMEMQMERARELWGAAGVDLSDVRWVDATGYPAAAQFQGTTNACGTEASAIGADEGRTNVYVSGGPLVRAGQRFGGYTCGATHIDMAAGSGSTPTLLAHELGHSFGLGHETGENLMNPSAIYGRITLGQVFWAHVRDVSAIPSRYAGADALPARNCALPGQCLPPLFDM